jgi:hypothetical protein
MSDRRPDCIYGVLVREGRVFLPRVGEGVGLPGGVFRPLAEDRKVELRAHLYDQLGIDARAIWAQGAFLYRQPGEEQERFSGFYTVWEWDGAIADDAGVWVDAEALDGVAVVAPLRILLLSVLATSAVRTR